MSDLMSSAFANFLDHRRATSSHRPPCGTPPPLPYPPLKLPVRLLHDSPPPAKRMRSSTSCTSSLTLPSVASPLASSLVSPVSVLTAGRCDAQAAAQQAAAPPPPPPPPPPLPLPLPARLPRPPQAQAPPPPPQAHGSTIAWCEESRALRAFSGVLCTLSAPRAEAHAPPLGAARLPAAHVVRATACVSESSKQQALAPAAAALQRLSCVQASSLSSSVTHGTTCGGGSHECGVCGAVFWYESALEQHHKRAHQRPYVCKMVGCSASFSKQNHLSRHIRIVHNKERPFACTEPGCTSRFGSKSHLGDHTRAVHMRLRNFKCNICNASWSKRFNLEKHIRIRHLGEKPFRCSLCALSFGTRSHVTRHELKVHKRALAPCAAANNSSSSRK